MMAHGKECCQSRRHEFNPWSRRIQRAAEELSPCTTTIEPVRYSLGCTAAEPTLCHYCSLGAPDPTFHDREAAAWGRLSTETRECAPLMAARAKPVQQQGPSSAAPEKRACARAAEPARVVPPPPRPEQWALRASPREPCGARLPACGLRHRLRWSSGALRC